MNSPFAIPLIFGSSNMNSPSDTFIRFIPVYTADTDILFIVIVPVLSRHIVWTEPSVSTASRCRIRILCLLISLMPRASVVVAMVGSPSGTAATAREIDVFNICRNPYPFKSPIANTPTQTAPPISTSWLPILSSCLSIGVSGGLASPTIA